MFNNSMRNKILFGFLFLVLFISPAYSQVYQPELENLGVVEFYNYEGPHTRIDTRAQIRGIGYDLGVMIKAGRTNAGGAGRYFVIHSVSAADGQKLDADIFGLGVDVGVDHIRNLRWIIQGYLEAAYGYSESDAWLLAEYITIYNAVHRGDMRYFESRYKRDVISNLTQEKAGLSIRYDEWPGRTLMLIPLGMLSAGPLSSINTTPLTDTQVTETLRQQPDMGLDSRMDMVDLKERQAEEAAQQAQIQREAIREEEARIAAERQRAQEQQRQLQEQQRQAQEQQRQAQLEQERIERERQQADADQRALDQRQRQAEEQARRAEEQQRQAEEQQRQTEERQRALEEEQRRAEEQRREAEQIEQYSEEKADEAQQDRRDIAEDQQSLIDQDDWRPAPSEGILGAMIIMQNSSLGSIIKIDPETGKETRRSVLNTINARTVTVIDGRLIAIAGEARGDGAIRLVEISPDTLSMIKQGDDDISPQSLIWTNGYDLFAITSSGGNNYLARFNSDLTRMARSSVTVHPFASAAITGDYIITQRADGTAVLLNLWDLTEKR